MPRDLHSLVKEDTLQGMAPLSKTDNHLDQREQPMDDADGPNAFEAYMEQRNEKRDQLHPYVQTLSISDLESCIRLEEASFPPEERATREKFEYRFKHCGELSLGIFTSKENSSDATASTAQPVYSGVPQRKAVLLGHIIATKTTNATVADTDMAIASPGTSDPALGHKEHGRTVCIHSLAVLPSYRRHGLGATLMKAYLQRIQSQGVADRAALLSHEHLVPFYEKLGFTNAGKSDAQFGGGSWYDLVQDLKPEDSDDEE